VAGPEIGTDENSEEICASNASKITRAKFAKKTIFTHKCQYIVFLQMRPYLSLTALPFA